MLKSKNMIELLLMLLKEDGNVLRNIFKIILLLKSVINVTFYTCSNQNVTITMCCFINFYKDSN